MTPTADELARARALIAVCRWTFATTVPEHPHEYALRRWLPREHQATFDWLEALIEDHGWPGRFWNQRWVYLAVDDRKYWCSDELFGTGRILNRALIAKPEPARQLTLM
jgi:hypothetical protein